MATFTFQIESGDGEMCASKKGYGSCTEAKHAAIFCGYAKYGDNLVCIYILQDDIEIKAFTP